MRFRFALSILALLLSGTVLNAQQVGTPEETTRKKRDAIGRLLELTEDDGLPEQGIQFVVAELQEKLRNQLVPGKKTDRFVEAFVKGFEKRTRRDYRKEFQPKIVSLWADRFDLEELQELVRIYESPLGKKLAKARKEISAQQAAALITWLDEVAVAVQTELAEEHPDWAEKSESTTSSEPIRVSHGTQKKKLIHRVKPKYPDGAKRARISGTVRLEALISSDGKIEKLKVLSGHPMLAAAAFDAVRLWRYEPTLINGEPVRVLTTIDVVFRIR